MASSESISARRDDSGPRSDTIIRRGRNYRTASTSRTDIRRGSPLLQTIIRDNSSEVSFYLAQMASLYANGTPTISDSRQAPDLDHVVLLTPQLNGEAGNGNRVATVIAGPSLGLGRERRGTFSSGLDKRLRAVLTQ